MENKEREELAEKLHDIYMKEADRQGNTRNARRYEDLDENVKEYDRVLADFILEDRKRVVAPLVDLMNELFLRYGRIGGKDSMRKYITQALRNAGYKDGENV